VSVCLLAEVAAEQEEAASGLMHLSGASGVEIRDGEGLLPPGVAPLPPGRAELRGYFERPEVAEAARALLVEKLGVRGLVEQVREELWAESWKRHFEPLRIGRLWVVPPWIAEAGPAGCERIVLEPGMAFGTGSHATTSLCLAALDRLLAARPGASVFDVGTGSGILAIAAAKLGAGRILATDDDPIAVRVAGENAAANGVGAAIEIADAGREPAGRFDIVVANILANTLVALAPFLLQRLAPGGTLLLSGLLVGQADEVAEAFAPRVSELPRQREQDWMLLSFQG
jgi:ribosomal protein L11 methyltransferase